MNTRISSAKTVSFIPIVVFCAFGWKGCSTTRVDPLPVPPPEVPGYVKVTHPDGLNQADLKAIFNDPLAPSRESLKDCDSDHARLLEKTQSLDELNQGARELVKLDSVKYHWCFYHKLLELDEFLKESRYIDERQDYVLKTYGFLTPMGRAFFMVYRDSRYLRWAIHRYRQLSELVFYRRVQISPQTETELVGAISSFEGVRPSGPGEFSVLAKYGIIIAEDIAEAEKLPEVEGRAPTADRPAVAPNPVSEVPTPRTDPASAP